MSESLCTLPGHVHLVPSSVETCYDEWTCETPHPDSCRWAWDGYEYVCNAAILHVMGQPTYLLMPWRSE